MPMSHTASVVSRSANDSSSSVTVYDAGAGRVVVVKNANTGNVVGSVFLSGSSTLNDAAIDVSSQSNPFRGEITVTSRNSPYTTWCSAVFNKMYRGDTFTVIADVRYNPPIVRGYSAGFRDRVPTLLKVSDFQRDIIEGHDVEYVGTD